MSDTVIKVENLSKHYHLGTIGSGTLSRDLQSWWARLRGKEDPNTKMGQWDTAQMDKDNSFWALKDISFEVKQGDVLGIIGRNGAGKSTLLKILSRVTGPTTGSIKIKGRVASLLEVGTGFHPELTGRENVYLNGTILGMRKQEIDRKFDEIVDFAEIEKFIDTPVKRYSSGMYVRLAFAVAAHLDPEILIVDEVLAVGDVDFQKKCFAKLKDVSRIGKTVLVVSHNMGAIRQLCDRSIVFEQGKIYFKGTTDGAINAYYSQFKNKTSLALVKEGEIGFVEWYLDNAHRESAHSIVTREEGVFVFRVHSKTQVHGVRLGFLIYGSSGEAIVSATSLDGDGKHFKFDVGLYEIVVRMKLPLKSGQYTLRVLLKDTHNKLCNWECWPELIILPINKVYLPDGNQGILNEDISFEYRKIEELCN